MRSTLRFAAPLAFALAACAPAAPPPAASTPAAAPATLEARRAELRAVVSDYWERNLRTSPELASILGDKRYNDRWSDPSEKAVHEDFEAYRAFLARLRAIDTAGMPEQEALDKTLLVRSIESDLAGERFEGWLMPVTQFGGAHVDMPQLVGLLSFDTVKDYDDYVARLRAIPTVLDTITALMRKGVTKDLTPPRVLLGEVAQQADNVAAPAPEESAFAAPLKKLPASFPDADKARLRAAVLEAIRDQVVSAYRKFAAFVRAEYEPHGHAEPGEWALPLGKERYEFDILRMTTTRLSADEIHEFGRREVARIEGEMQAVARKLGHADFKALAAAIDKDPARHFHSRQEIVDLYKKDIDQMYARLPSLFGRLPKAKIEVLPVEEFREKGASAAQYDTGTPDGSRPGHVMVNTGEFAKRSMVDVESTAYHEGVPGHHLQLSIAQELGDLPPFRQHYPVTAFVEGWGLYAERLGEDVGFYQDPYSYFGHLQDEMLRAIRLVVDTGLHAKKWSRQEVVDYFHAHSTIEEVEVQSETNRYMAWPGQALAYKIGQLKFLELRERAKKAMGAKFDVRAYHDLVLGAGALPLDVLEQRVDAWIASKARG